MIYVFGNDIIGPVHSPLSLCACGFCNFTDDDFEKHTQYVNLTKMSYFLKSAHTAIHLNGNGVNFETHNLRFPY